MKSRRIMFLALTLSLLVLAITPQVVKADITGNTYYFTSNWLEQTYQKDSGAIFESSIDGSFSITVLNTTEVGGDDAYEYNYHGFDYFIIPYPVDHNDTVEFIEQKVYFDLVTNDIDNDSRSEGTTLYINPSYHFAHPGRQFFVNPVWSTHNTDWNNAVDDLEDNEMVHDIVESSGEGSFSLQCIVDGETIYSGLGPMNGTNTYSFSASYDVDGVLSSWVFSQVLQYSNENHTMYTVQSSSYARGTGTGTGGLDINVPLVYVGAISVGALVVGVIIGRKVLT